MSGPFYAKGWYRVDVTDIGMQKSKNGNPMIVTKFVPLAELISRLDEAGERITDEIPVSNGYTRTSWLTIVEDNEQSLDFALMKLRNAGWQGTSMRELEQLRGQQIVMACDHQPGRDKYAGTMQEKWDWPLPERESTPVENDSDVVRKVDALFGRKLKTGVEKKSPSTPMAPENGKEHLLEDGDIPF